MRILLIDGPDYESGQYSVEASRRAELVLVLDEPTEEGAEPTFRCVKYRHGALEDVQVCVDPGADEPSPFTIPDEAPRALVGASG